MIRWRDKAGYLRPVPEFAVTAIGSDRPGIVAAISGALLELDGNIEDSQMSILRGHFAVMLLVKVPASIDREKLAERLGGIREELGLEAITISELGELPATAPRPSHVITVYGADHPGIVHAVTSALAERGVNVTDLETRLTGSEDSPLYAMMMEVALGGVPEAEVEVALREVGAAAEVEVSLRPLEIESL
jgi:glycine cleavage system transcriptional repressor